MSELFDGPRARIQSATENLIELRQLIQEYVSTNPYEHFQILNRARTHYFHKLRVVKRIPPRIPLKCGHVAEDLRAAIDTAISACAIANGVPNPSNMGVPFCKDDADFPRAAGGKCKNVPPSVIDILRSHKPYPSGNKLICDLNELANQGKHVALVPIANQNSNSFHSMRIEGGRVKLFPHTWDKLKNEITLMQVEVGTKIQGKIDVTYRIAFGKVGGLEHTDPLEILPAMLNGTTGLVSELETEIDRVFP